ncbi:transposase [Plantactinospora sp. DSM 117369]
MEHHAPSPHRRRPCGIRQPVTCACWLAGSSNSPTRSRTSTSESPRRSTPTHTRAAAALRRRPDTAASLLLAGGDNPQRLTSEASFAALCGVSPIEMSSGKTQRRRLNRGADRQANSALYKIVIARLRWDLRTRAYIDRRLSKGKTRREAVHCLKRYVARELYELIAQTPQHTSAPSTA